MKTGRQIKAIAERINIKDVIAIVIGTFLMALSINTVFDPLGLDVGGVTGLAVAVKYATASFIEGGIPVWFTNVAINVPLIVISIIKKGWRYMAKTGFSTAIFSLWLYVLPIVTIVEDDLLLASLFGGVMSGVGMGMVFSVYATTGGSDLFASLIHDRWRHISIPKLLMVTDAIIVAAGIPVFGIEKVLYAIIVVFAVSKVSDSILDGMRFAKVAYIISDKAQEITDEILTDIDRGVTGIEVKGMYSGDDRNMLFCVVSSKQIVELKDIVNRHDKRAFMVISDAHEVMGEGFSSKKD